MAPSIARSCLRAVIARPDPKLSLAKAALCIAWEDQGGAPPLAALTHLAAMVEELRPRLHAAMPARLVVDVLNDYLFREQGFHGDPACYERPDPAYSFLDRVLERRTGLPILLSLVFLEIGWRLGLPVSGVGLPGHFIARFIAGEEEIFIDPFGDGQIWSQADCLRQVRTAYPNPSPALVEQIMAPPSKRAILVRILRNLKHTYIPRWEFGHALATVERIIMLDHPQPEEIRDRALIRLRLGQIHGALKDLDRYARLAPNAPDLAHLRAYADSLARDVMGRN